MPIADGLVAEFEHEAKVTRSLLARVPDDRATWKPHAKSMSLGELAIHLANIPSYGLPVATRPELNFQEAASSAGHAREVVRLATRRSRCSTATWPQPAAPRRP